MKKKIWIIIVVLLILIIPIPGGRYKDGGTKEYKAITYKIVVWNRLLGEDSTYHKTSVFWFPNNFKRIDELWGLEYNQDMESTDNASAINGIHSIKYDLGSAESDFTGTPSEAKTGDLVEIKTNGVIYDGDIHVYVDGQEISKSHYESDYWGYSFVMPDRDVLVTARFYTKDEILGLDTDMDALKAKYPEYFDLPTSKGLEVYVWQIVPNSYSFGVLEGTNREKTLEELWNLKGTTAKEMRTILSSYDIEESDIIVIPWQNPVSSYIAEYWIMEKDEDPDSVAKRRQEYIDRIRAMLFDDTFSYADWSDITADGLDEASFYKKLDTDLLQEISAKFQALIEEEEAEERENPEIVITEGWTRIFRKKGYKEVISLGEKAEMPLYFILYKSPNNGLYEYMCATALSELTGLSLMEESGAPYGWTNAKEYLELFNEYMASKNDLN